MKALRNIDWGFTSFAAFMVLFVVGAIAALTYGEVHRKRDERKCLDYWSSCPAGHIAVYMWPEERCFCALEVRP